MLSENINADIKANVIGDRSPIVIGLVAASGYAINAEAVARGIENLQAQGCIVKNFSDADRKFQRFGATDDERIAQLYAAAQDPEVDIVLAPVSYTHLTLPTNREV